MRTYIGEQGEMGQEGDLGDQPCPSFTAAGHYTAKRPGFQAPPGA